MNLVGEIKKANDILVVGHVRPDGDCLGAGLTIKLLCEALNKNCDILCDSDIPKHFSFLPKFDEINNPSCSQYDLLICIDCGDLMRLGKYAGYIGKIKSINIDHHITNNGFGTLNYVRADSASTCQLIYELIHKCEHFSSDMAYCLFCGLSTDTGHFMHSNTDSAVLNCALQLCEHGVNVNNVANNLYRSNTIQKTKLMSRAINSMRFFMEEQICVISIMQSDLAECGCVLADTEGLIDLAMNIKNVQVAVCLTQQRATLYKISFRSKSIDVSAAAGVFGGGGHKMAAGCVIGGQYEDVISKIVKSITDGMAD